MEFEQSARPRTVFIEICVWRYFWNESKVLSQHNNSTIGRNLGSNHVNKYASKQQSTVIGIGLISNAMPVRILRCKFLPGTLRFPCVYLIMKHQRFCHSLQTAMQLTTVEKLRGNIIGQYLFVKFSIVTFGVVQKFT